jgi:hypothetical protein
MIKYHTNADGKTVAEILSGSEIIASPDDILDMMVSAGYQDCNKLVIHDKSLHQDFFDLKTGLAGEILQKFSNYRMKLAIVGDFSGIKSKSFNDFVRESNKWGIISFVDSLEKALT